MPVVTIALVLLNIFVFGVERATDGAAFCEVWGLVPHHLEPSALVTHLFVHDYRTVWHIALNVLYLAFVGSIVEIELGGVRFLALFLLAGVFGGLIHVLVNPSSVDPLVGASGAIYGVLAVAAILYPRFLVLVVGLGLVNLWHATFSVGDEASFGAHLGGLLAGVLFGAAMRVTGQLEEA